MDEVAKELTVVKDTSTDRFFSQRQRQLNIDMVLNAVDGKTDFDFQTMLYAYADLAHSVFMNGLMAEASSEDEAQQIQSRIVRTANSLLDVMENAKMDNAAEDFTALMSVALNLLDYMLKVQAEAEATKNTP